jgi:hypothetical protein
MVPAPLVASHLVTHSIGGATNTARMHVPEAQMPNDGGGLMSQVVDLPSDTFIRVV